MKLDHSRTAHICRGLALLLHGGIGLADGVYLLAGEETGPVRGLLEDIGAKMDAGLPLSQAMEESGAFPAHASGMVLIGETTGRMEQALNALADFYEERCRTARQLKQALAYPCMILLLMLAVIAVLLIKVLPVFDSVYASLGSRLTGISAGLLTFGQLLEASLPVLLVLLTLLAAAALACYLFVPVREKLSLRYARRFGDRGVSRKFNNARFARAMSMGIGSGLRMEEALALSQKLLEDIPGAAQRCARCAALLEAGVDIPKAMGDTGLLTPAQSRMLAVGLRGGNADRVLEEIADRSMEEASDALDALVSGVEPAMVLMASALVGLILLAVMLPLANIMSTLG